MFYFRTWDFPPGEPFWDGLPVSADTVPCIGLTIRFFGYGSGGYDACVDATTCDSVPEWYAQPGPELAFGGARCYEVNGSLVNAFLPEISGPSDCYISRCGMASIPLIIEESIVLPYDHGIEVVSGPTGTIIEMSDAWFIYEYVPTPDEAGQTLELVLWAWMDFCGDGSTLFYGPYYTLNIHVAPDYCADDPVKFNVFQPHNFVATTGDTLRMTPIIEDDGPCTDYTYSWHIFEPEPTPANYWIEEETGTFCYLGQTQDTGKYWVYGVVKEHNVADTMLMIINHFESFIPGDCDHSGNIDMGDLTWLISSLFINFVPPIPPEAGDVDCSSAITMSDLTMLIDHLFISFNPFPTCP